MNTLAPRIRLTANEPCHCGSGKKYKFCCREQDQEADRDARLAQRKPVESQQGSQHDHPAGLCQFYRASNRGTSAVNRRDFKWLATRMNAEGRTILHIAEPRDLGSRPEHLRAALEHLEQAHIKANFQSDPTVEMLAAMQQTLDLLCGAGAYRVRGSGWLWGRAGRNTWRLDRDGTPAAFCGRDNPIGFALLGARCRDLIAEGHELPLPLLRIVAGANLLAEIAQTAPQIDEIFRTELPEWSDGGAVNVARAVYQRVVDIDDVMPESPDGEREYAPSGLLSCALAFAGGFTAPEAALDMFSLSDQARAEYLRALHHAQDSAPVCEIMEWIPDVDLPPDRSTAQQLRSVLEEHRHPLAEEAADAEDRAAVGIGVVSIREPREVAAHSTFEPSAPERADTEAAEDGDAEGQVTPDAASVVEPAAARLDALLASTELGDALKRVSEQDPELDAALAAAQRRLDLSEAEVGAINAELEQLRAQLRQLQSDVAEADKLQRIRAQARDEARTDLDGLNVRGIRAKVAALTTALEASAEVVASAAETETIHAAAMERIFADPTAAPLQRRLDDFEAMQRDGRLGQLPESAVQALQAAADEARNALSVVAPVQMSRRRVEVPIIVAASVATRGNEPEQRLRMDFLVPVGTDVVAGPPTRLAARFGKGVRELVEYLDLPFMSVAVEQRGTVAGNSVVRIESVLSAAVDPRTVTEAAEVMLELTIADDDASLIPILLVPEIRSVTPQLVDALPITASPEPELKEGDPEAATLDLNEAALRLGCTPLVATVRFALHGMPLEDDGQVPPDALRAMTVSGDAYDTRLADGDPDDSAQRELELDGSARLGRGVYDFIRRDSEVRRRTARGVLLRLVRENRWLPGATDMHDALRLLPPHLLGEGRDAVAELERVGWIGRADPRRKDQIASIGLVAGHRDEILRYTRTGEGAPQTLAAWVAAGVLD